MNEPIVSPWIVYGLGLVDKISCATEMISMLCLFVFVVGGTVYVVFKADGIIKPKEGRTVLAILKGAAIGFVLCSFLWVAIPSKNTLIGMYLADNITHARVEKILKAGKAVHKALKADILELIREATKKEKKK